MISIHLELLNALVPQETHAYCEKNGLRLNGRKPEQHRNFQIVQDIISRTSQSSEGEDGEKYSSKVSLEDQTIIIGTGSSSQKMPSHALASEVLTIKVRVNLAIDATVDISRDRLEDKRNWLQSFLLQKVANRILCGFKGSVNLCFEVFADGGNALCALVAAC